MIDQRCTLQNFIKHSRPPKTTFHFGTRSQERDGLLISFPRSTHKCSSWFVQLVFTCLHVSSRVFTCLHVSSRVFTCLHVSSRVFTCIHVSSRVFTCLHVSSRVFTCLHVSSRVFTCLHVSSRVFTCLHVIPLVFALLLIHRVIYPSAAKFQETGSSHVDHKDVDPMSTKYVVYETGVRSKEHRDRVGTCLYQKCQKKLMIRK